MNRPIWNLHTIFLDIYNIYWSKQYVFDNNFDSLSHSKVQICSQNNDFFWKPSFCQKKKKISFIISWRSGTMVSKHFKNFYRFLKYLKFCKFTFYEFIYQLPLDTLLLVNLYADRRVLHFLECQSTVRFWCTLEKSILSCEEKDLISGSETKTKYTTVTC